MEERRRTCLKRINLSCCTDVKLLSRERLEVSFKSHKKRPNSELISHLFGHPTRRVTWVASPGGRKGRRLGRENWDKGWAERGRWRGGSWDVADSKRTRLKTDTDGGWRDPRFWTRQNRTADFFSRPIPPRHSRSEFNFGESLESFGKQARMSRRQRTGGQGMRRESERGMDGGTYWRRRLAGGQKCDLNGEVWGNEQKLLTRWNKGPHCLHLPYMFSDHNSTSLLTIVLPFSVFSFFLIWFIYMW